VADFAAGTTTWMTSSSSSGPKLRLSDILRQLEARDRTHAVLKAIAARMLWRRPVSAAPPSAQQADLHRQ
jgi:hypothetical protein